MADVTVTMSGDEARLTAALQKVIDKEAKMRAGFKGVGNEAKAAGRKAKGAFGGRAATDIKNYAMGMLSVGAAIRIAGGAMKYFQEETAKAREGLNTLVESRRMLIQIAQDSSDLQRTEDKADFLAARYGVSRDTVRRSLFAGRSEGFEEFVPRLIQAEGANVISALAGSAAAGQIPGLFRNDPITPAQSVNAVLFGAQQSRLNFEELSASLPSAAEGAAQAGASTAETIGVMSVLPSQFASGKTAADRMKAFGARVALDDRLRGHGLVESAEMLQAMPEEQRRAFLGTSQELNAAYSMLISNMDKIKDRIVGVQQAINDTGTSRSVMTRQINLALDQRTTAGQLNASTQRANRARIGREVANERIAAEQGNDRQAAINNAIADLKEEGLGWWGQFVAEKLFANPANFLGVPSDMIEDNTKFVGRLAGDTPLSEPPWQVFGKFNRMRREREEQNRIRRGEATGNPGAPPVGTIDAARVQNEAAAVTREAAEMLHGAATNLERASTYRPNITGGIRREQAISTAVE